VLAAVALLGEGHCPGAWHHGDRIRLQPSGQLSREGTEYGRCPACGFLFALLPGAAGYLTYARGPASSAGESAQPTDPNNRAENDHPSSPAGA
jgi:hypothetical protein